MQIDRLIGILSILLQQDKVTAPYLAERFEVSRRTINRDIEALCKAGIPLVTTQGREGGISIVNGYRVDRTLLTSSEMQSILTGLKSLDSVCKTNKYQQLMDKLSVKQGLILSQGSRIAIDLSSHYKDKLAPKMELIQGAAERCRVVEFDYYAPSGEGHRAVEPYMLIFQWSSWYMWGYSLERQDYRLFKLNRMQNVTETDTEFEPRSFPAYDGSTERVFPPEIHVTALFCPEMKWRLIDEYGPDCYEELEDGSLLLHMGFTDRENLFTWILSFGDRAELLEPADIREDLAKRLREMIKKYPDDGKT